MKVPSVASAGHRDDRGWSLVSVSVMVVLSDQADTSGYHPWFAHRYALQEGSKEDHYRSIFNLHRTSTSKNAILLGQLLPYLPDPMPFDALLQELRQDLRTSLDRGSLTMLGEVGLDGAARLRWPKDAQHLDPSVPNSPASTSGLTESANDQPGASGSRLTPFKTSMAHQRAVLDAQLDLAVAVGVNISVHSVAAPGASPAPES